MDEATALPLVKKRSAKHFSVDDKQHVLNIFNSDDNDNPHKTKTQKVQFTATAAGVSVRSVFKILNEYTNTHEFIPPKRYHSQRIVSDNIDDDTKSALRRLIQSFFEKNEPPTLNKILALIHENDAIPDFKRTSLWKLMKEIGFRFSKRSRNSVLKEKHDIIVWRRRFLREIRKHREEGRKLYFLDETWVNAGHTVNKVWKDTSVIMPRQAFIEGLTSVLKDPSGKGGRLIVLHIGSEDGFVENATKKADIQAWLTNNLIAYEADMLKCELLDLVKRAAVTPRYVVDEMARQQNRTILRLPPYHYELNLIELIWGQIKEVASNKTTFKMKDMYALFQQAVRNVSPDNWRNAIRHAKGEEEKMWQVDNVMETTIEQLEINVGNDSSSEEKTFSETDSD